MPYVYLVQCSYFKDDVFKIGGSKKIETDRLKSYGKGTKILAMIVVNGDYHEVENQLKFSFNSKFTLVHGREYFQGNEDEIKLEFLKIVYNYQLNNSHKTTIECKDDTVDESKDDTVDESKDDTVDECILGIVNELVDTVVDISKYRRFQYHLINALNSSNNDIAKALYEKYRDTFVCSSIPNKTWYLFKNRWEQIEYKVLRENFFSDILNIYGKMGQEILVKLIKEENRDDEELLKSKLKAIQKMYGNCKSVRFKNNVMNEVMTLFIKEPSGKK